MVKISDTNEIEHTSRTVRVNVGGKLYTTLSNTLQEAGLIGTLITNRDTAKDVNGHPFIDISHKTFSIIIGFLRMKRCTLPNPHTEKGLWKTLLQDVRYLCLDEMEQYMKSKYPVYFFAEEIRMKYKQSYNTLITCLNEIGKNRIREHRSETLVCITKNNTNHHEVTVTTKQFKLSAFTKIRVPIIESKDIFDMVSNPYWSLYTKKLKIRGYILKQCDPTDYIDKEYLGSSYRDKHTLWFDLMIDLASFF